MEDPHVAQCLLRLALLGDVPHRDDDAAELVVDRLRVRGDELDLCVGAVGALETGPDVGSVVLAGQVLGEAQRDVLDVVGVDQPEAVDAEEVAGLAAEEPVEARGRG